MDDLPVHARSFLDQGEVNSGLAVRPPNKKLEPFMLSGHLKAGAPTITGTLTVRRRPIRRMVAAVKKMFAV